MIKAIKSHHIFSILYPVAWHVKNNSHTFDLTKESILLLDVFWGLVKSCYIENCCFLFVLYRLTRKFIMQAVRKLCRKEVLSWQMGQAAQGDRGEHFGCTEEQPQVEQRLRAGQQLHCWHWLKDEAVGPSGLQDPESSCFWNWDRNYLDSCKVQGWALQTSEESWVLVQANYQQVQSLGHRQPLLFESVRKPLHSGGLAEGAEHHEHGGRESSFAWNQWSEPWCRRVPESCPRVAEAEASAGGKAQGATARHHSWHPGHWRAWWHTGSWHFACSWPVSLGDQGPNWCRGRDGQDHETWPFNQFCWVLFAPLYLTWN